MDSLSANWVWLLLGLAVVWMLLSPSAISSRRWSRRARRQRRRTTLRAKREVLDALAKGLIESEVIDRNALTRLIAETRA